MANGCNARMRMRIDNGQRRQRSNSRCKRIGNGVQTHTHTRRAVVAAAAAAATTIVVLLKIVRMFVCGSIGSFSIYFVFLLIFWCQRAYQVCGIFYQVRCCLYTHSANTRLSRPSLRIVMIVFTQTKMIIVVVVVHVGGGGGVRDKDRGKNRRIKTNIRTRKNRNGSVFIEIESTDLKMYTYSVLCFYFYQNKHFFSLFFFFFHSVDKRHVR